MLILPPLLMEFLNPTMQTHSQFSSKSTFFSPKYPLTRQRIKIPPNPNTYLSKFFLYPSFPLNLLRDFSVSAHFGRPTSRKNYLRKKLTQSQHPQLQHQQVSQNPTIHHPGSNFENPVDKADSEFWGMGSGHIFTVYENTDGKVERVDVDEAEILRRNDIEPLLYEINEVQEFKEVNSKIAHAKNIAREMENGNNMLSKNSSVIKFVKSGGGLGFVNVIQRFTLDNMLSKNSSMAEFVKSGRGLGFVSGIQRFTLDKPSVLSKWSIIGLTGLFGLVLVLSWKRLFTAERGKKGYSRFKTNRGKKWFSLFTTKRGKEGYTSKEKEMLRRKMKARMEREKLEKGSVEVIQDYKEPEIVFTEKPLLDKQDFMNTIDAFSLIVPFVTPVSESTDFDSELEGIGARDSRVREIEAEEEQTVNGFSNEKQVILKNSTSSNDPQVDDTTSLSETPYPQSRMPEDSHVKSKPRVINSVKEARKYLSNKHNKREKNQETEVRPVQEVDFTVNIQSKYGKLGSQQLDGTPCSDPTTFAGKTKENRGMDRTVREMEEMDTQQGSMGDEEDGQSVSGFSNENDVTKIKSTFLGDAVADDDTERSNMMSTSDDLASKIPSDISPRESVNFESEIKREMTGLVSSARKTESKDSLPGDSSNKEEEHQIVNRFSNEKKVKRMKSMSLENSQVGDTRTLGETPRLRSNKHGENSVRAKPRIIQSVKEAREYLSQKHDSREQNQEAQIRTAQEVGSKVKAEMVGRNGGPLSQYLGSNRSSEISYTASAPGDDTLKREKTGKGEYAEEKEVDYLWWLDLPVVMCIEICKDEDGDKRIGLYSLEMGSDLELEPKPHHVISFEDATDCQNFCYIIQSQMDMLGSGEAFVVAQYPKDAYRDAEANGFNVTVIRKGELKLNVDQTLKEVEELITEIGSKMYHDQITREKMKEKTEKAKEMMVLDDARFSQLCVSEKQLHSYDIVR